ncbi:hypothetical protein R4Z09_21800 [Niallia oryzisoli]|uniref:Uncharacterized protein n=1 Tax=Niallia oryzisoli TaxID=1737571 RepID=A0ABZ2C8C9_9BACI
MKNNDQYDFANLSNSELKQVNSLQEELSKETGEDVVLIAYADKKKE